VTFEDLIDCAGSDPGRFSQIVAADHTVLERRNSLGETLLHWLAIEGRVGPVRQLLAHGADPNTKDKHGNAVLANTAMVGHTEVALALLDAGADPNAASYDNPALLLAVEEERPELVKTLLEHGASTEVGPDAHGSLREALDECREDIRPSIESLLHRYGWNGL
jgi:ankyrin repeat protein